MNKRNIPAMTWKNGEVVPTTIEEIRKRMKPISLEYLIDALQDPTHKEVGKSRPAKVTKRKSK